MKAVHKHLRDTITGVLAQKDFNLHSDRCHKLQEFGKELVTKITTEDEATTTAMSEFVTALLPILQDERKNVCCTTGENTEQISSVQVCYNWKTMGRFSWQAEYSW